MKKNDKCHICSENHEPQVECRDELTTIPHINKHNEKAQFRLKLTDYWERPCPYFWNKHKFILPKKDCESCKEENIV